MYGSVLESFAVVKLPAWPVDWPLMLAYALSSNTWWAVAFLTAVSVLTILGMMAKILRYELMLIKVVSSARTMRTKLQQSIDEVEQENNPRAAEASKALKDAKVPPAQDQSEDAQQTAYEDQAQEDEQSTSDENSEQTADPDSPDYISSNIDVAEPDEESENLEATAA